MIKTSLLVSFFLLFTGFFDGFAQVKSLEGKPLAEVYYFHPSERCPIDQSIEQNLIKLIQGSFAKEVKEGKIKFQVINTDDKSLAKTVARFEINAQALYVVKLRNGKETKNDLTKFAFDYGQSNPDRFRSGLKVEIEKALQ
ncbi:MAG: nitrophenyl compound nitroreductase subunit ArsF family protein [Bacteroidetes bacterium]|nr:nitrophenyl compound nitroreductase subunit ArsF family protein [Bacteroidota bacterium]